MSVERLVAVAQLAFVAVWAIAGALQQSYSVRDQPVSDLAARTADHRWLMAAGFIVLGASVVLVGRRLRGMLGARRGAHLAAGLLLAAGLGWIAIGFLPLDCSITDATCRAASDSGRLSTEHYLHIWLSFGVGVLVSVSPFAVAWALWPGRAARGVLAVALACDLVQLVGFFVLGRDGAGLGLWQRAVLVLMQAWFIWIAATSERRLASRP
jgi:hypothetical membrane protein